jgi:hypothetical protein
MTGPMAEADRRELARLDARIARLQAELDGLDVTTSPYPADSRWHGMWQADIAERRRRVSRVITRHRRRERALLAAHDLPADGPRTEPPGAPGSLELRED